MTHALHATPLRPATYRVVASSARIRASAMGLVVDNLKRGEHFTKLEASPAGWAFGFAKHDGQRIYGWVPLKAGAHRVLKKLKAHVSSPLSASQVARLA